MDIMPISGSPLATKLVLVLSVLLLIQLVVQQLITMWDKPQVKLLLASLITGPAVLADTVDIKWYAPSQSNINNLTGVLSGSGVYGFIYNTSHTPDAQYGTYNWCNMPHVRKREYIKPSDEYELKYVELVSTKTWISDLRA
jgi:acid phosphatase